MTSIASAYGLFEVRMRFEPEVDTHRLIEDAHGLVYSRQLALEVDSDNWGFGRTWYEPPRTPDGSHAVAAEDPRPSLVVDVTLEN